MDLGERMALMDACKDEDKRILKATGYYHSDLLREGKKPEDFKDVDEAEIEKIAGFLQTHPILPRHKKRKRVYFTDTYYLGGSYGLKHVVENFIGYITNGDFIAACMKTEGYIVVPDPDSPNASIYIWRGRVDRHLSYYITV